MSRKRKELTTDDDSSEPEESNESKKAKLLAMASAAAAASTSSSSSSSSSSDNQDDNDEVADEDADLSWFLQNLHLKKIIKENHGNSINGVILNKNAPYSSNMVATFSDNQVNFYDNQHITEHLDPCLHFINETTEHTKGGVIPTFTSRFLSFLLSRSDHSHFPSFLPLVLSTGGSRRHFSPATR
eukprot:TRINITY_DN1254_c0_g1_i1.p1 TRINITY_DN1254_c0_g1~~TRINITY_DN1254_c0_g1_i1.p1  ORF type:complete len:197 (-),score=58.26 TRINITY_DN1254_c0_g1_i1:383-937(-)